MAFVMKKADIIQLLIKEKEYDIKKTVKTNPKQLELNEELKIN